MNSDRTALQENGTGTAIPKTRQVPDVIVRVGVDGILDVNGLSVSRYTLTSTLDTYYNNGARRVVLSISNSATVQDLVYALERARSSRFKAVEMVR